MFLPRPWLVFVLVLASFSARAQWPTPAAPPEAAKPAEAKSDGQKAVEEAPVPKLVDDEKKEDPNTMTFSAAVNVLRQGSRVEVVFRNGESYTLPSGSRQRQIYDALEESERTGKAVSVVVDTRSGVIRSVGSSNSKADKK